MERWKDIPGYEGCYQASTFGRVRSSPGRLVKNNGFYGDKIQKEKLLHPVLGKDGRERVTLSKNNTVTTYLLSRIIAVTWVPGYKEGLTVNHINGNKQDNSRENLEWLTRGDNIRYGYKQGQYRNRQIKATIVYTATGKELPCDSLAEASRRLGMRNGYVSNYTKKYASRLSGGTIELPHCGVVIKINHGNDGLLAFSE